MLSYFHRFSVFVWTGENDSNTLRVDAYFFENGEKNLRFYVWTGPQLSGSLHRAIANMNLLKN